MTDNLTALRFEAAAWERGTGRTIIGKAAPYDTVGTIEGRDGSTRKVRLEPGVFRRAMRAPHRVEMRFEHGADSNIMAVVGHGVSLEEKADGLYGSWRALDTPVGEQALALIDAGITRGLSVGFYQRAAHTDADGTLVITTGHLVEVSLCREAAFAGAEVQMVAHAPRLERSSELDERLRSLGLLQ